jgi:hypothetical protein
VALLITRRLALATVLSLVSPSCSGDGNGDRLEYQVKAAFLFNFLKFVEWPASAANSPTWVIGVLGRDPFGEVLDETVRGKVVNGRAVEIRRYARPADAKDCNILFIGRAEFERVGMTARPGLLTVGEAPAFLKSGGMINFYLEDNRVRFEIRASAAHDAGLHVSSQLLKLGRAL